MKNRVIPAALTAWTVLAAWIVPTVPAAAEVSLLRVIPSKIVYAPNESGTVEVTLANPGKKPESGTLRLTERRDLETTRPLGEFPFSLAAGETRSFPLPYRSGRERYGREIRCEVRQNGKTVAAKGEFFNVIREWWRVNQGSGYSPRAGSPQQDRVFAWYGMPANRAAKHSWFPWNTGATGIRRPDRSLITEPTAPAG